MSREQFWTTLGYAAAGADRRLAYAVSSGILLERCWPTLVVRKEVKNEKEAQ